MATPPAHPNHEQRLQQTMLAIIHCGSLLIYYGGLFEGIFGSLCGGLFGG